MTATLIGLACFLVGVLVGRQRSYGRGVRHGQRLTELAHGYIPALVPGIHKRRRWNVLNRKVPEPPGLVERHITPTNERPPIHR